MNASNPAADMNQSIDSLSDQIFRAVREALAAGAAIPVVETPYPLPFIRAARGDYARIVQLWKEFHANRPVEMNLPERHCPGCGGGRHRLRFLSYDLYPFHLCEDCGSFFVPFLVEEDFIERFLAAVPEARTISDRMMASRDRETMASDHERFTAYFSMAEKLSGSSAQGKRYLDIGCGVGHSIDAAAERGYEAVGLEISRTALATAHARGRNCHHPDEWKGENGFQLVTLFETLEHVANPRAMLEEARTRLDRQGLLVITIPNGAGWEVSLLRERCLHAYGGSDGVGHINMLSPEGLSALLRRCGFEPLLFDGQFGNNAILTMSGLLDLRQEAMAPTGDGELTLRLPQQLQRLLLRSGPALTALDRADLRSPILIAIACRSEDASHFRPQAKVMEQERRAAILGELPGAGSAKPDDAALFDGKASDPVPNMIDPGLVATFKRSSANQQVRTGLCLHSYAPLKFESILKLGQGRLKAGRYELAAAALLRAGAAALGVLDEKRQEWLAISNIDPDEYWKRLPFTLDGTTRVSFFITANNTEPAAVDLELFDAGVASVR